MNKKSSSANDEPALGGALSSSSSAISLRERLEDTDEEMGLPPPYTDDPTRPFLDHDHEASDPNDQFKVDVNLKTWLHEDHKGSTFTVVSNVLANDPVELKEYIERSARSPPTGYIRIKGTHSESQRGGNSTGSNGASKSSQEVVDFDFRIDITKFYSSTTHEHPSCDHYEGWNYLNIVENYYKTYRGTRLKSASRMPRAEVESSFQVPSLEVWCHMFCASDAALKSFTLRSVIDDFDYELVKQQVESLLRLARYRGRVVITFPLHPRTVTVQSNHWLNRARNNKFICFFFYLTFLWIITWPILFLATRRWAVVESRWLTRRRFDPRNAATDDAAATASRGGATASSSASAATATGSSNSAGSPGVDTPVSSTAGADGITGPLPAAGSRAPRSVVNGEEYYSVSEGELCRRWGYSIQRSALNRVSGGTVIQLMSEDEDRRRAESLFPAGSGGVGGGREGQTSFVRGALDIMHGASRLMMGADPDGYWGMDS